MAFVIGITSWPWTARAVRAQASSVSTREHIDVARLSGAKTFSLVSFDVLPYILSYVAWRSCCRSPARSSPRPACRSWASGRRMR